VLCARHGSRHVGHAIVDNAVYHERGVRMGGGVRRFDAAALVNATSTMTLLGFMVLTIWRVTSLGACAPLMSTAPTSRSARRTAWAY